MCLSCLFISCESTKSVIRPVVSSDDTSIRLDSISTDGSIILNNDVKDKTWQPRIIFVVEDKDRVVAEILKWRDLHCDEDTVYHPVYPFYFLDISETQAFGQELLHDYGIASMLVDGEDEAVYLVCYTTCLDA